ncbi:MAG: hypothetical protein AABX03_02090 [Nanoarchaeota archaeon]
MVKRKIRLIDKTKDQNNNSLYWILGIVILIIIILGIIYFMSVRPFFNPQVDLSPGSGSGSGSESECIGHYCRISYSCVGKTSVLNERCSVFNTQLDCESEATLPQGYCSGGYGCEGLSTSGEITCRSFNSCVWYPGAACRWVS